MPNASPSSYTITSVTHALEVLDILLEQQTLRVRDVARRLDIAPSSARRLLMTMQQKEYLTQDPHTRIYRAGSKMLTVQAMHPLGEELRSASHPVMENLRDAVGESVSLSVRVEGEVVFIEGVDSRQALRASPRIGARLPAYATASGKIHLASLTPEQIEELYPLRLKALTPFTITDRDDLQVALSQVRKQGYCLSHEQSTRRLSAVAVPVLSSHGKVKAALSVMAPSERLTPELVPRVVDRLHTAAHNIERFITEDIMPAAPSE